MMKIRRKILNIVFCTALLFVTTTSLAQNNNILAISAADSSAFSINKKMDWQLYNSYLSEQGSDSVTFEVTVRHENNLKWEDEQFIGKIKNALFFPKFSQQTYFNLIDNFYSLRIEPDGNCYLRLMWGSPPENDPSVIPIKVLYKKN